MADQVELLFKFDTQGAPQLDEVAKIVEQLGQKSALTGGQINMVESALKTLVASGESARSALEAVAASGATLGREAANAAKALLEVAPAAATAATSIRSVGTAAADSVPKVIAASAALRGIDGAMNIRAAERFISTISGLGPILQAAFPLFGIVALSEYLVVAGDKVVELYEKWNPVNQAEKISLQTLKDSGKELEKLIEQSKRLAIEEGKRKYGSIYGSQLQENEEQHNVLGDQFAIDNIKAQIGEAQARVAAGSGPRQVLVGGGTARAPSLDAEAAQKSLIGLTEELKRATEKLKVDNQKTSAQNDETKDLQANKSLESARKVEAIEKQIEAIKERSLALADKAELGTGPLADIEERRRAENRRYTTERADLAVSVRENRMGGPDVARVPQGQYDALSAAQAQAHTQNLASLDAEKSAAVEKILKEFFDKALELGIKAREAMDKADAKAIEEEAKDRKAALDLKIKNTEQSNKVAELGDKADEVGLQQQFKKSSRLAELAVPVGSTQGSLDAAGNAYRDRLTIAQALDVIAQRNVDREAALSTLKGTEYDRDYAAGQARLKLTQETGDAEIDYAIKVAEIQRKRLEDARTESGKVFDALIGGQKSIESLAKSFALSQGKAIFQNETQNLFSSASTSLHGLVSPGSPLASLLKGTILEPSGTGTPIDANTVALNNLTAVLAAASGFRVAGISTSGITGGLSGSGGLSAILGKFGSDTNGPTGQGPLYAPSSSYDPTAGGGYSDVPNYAQEAQDSGLSGGGNGSSSVTKGVGYASAAVAGAYGVYAGIKQGGARGTLNAVGSALGTAAMFDPEPISKAVLAVAGLVTGIASSLLGDPKAIFDAAQTKTLNNDKYTMPQVINGNFDVATGSNAVTSNYRGGTSVVLQNNTVVHVNALDYQSLASRKDDLAKVIGDVTRAGNPDMQIAINRVVFGPGAA